MIKTMDYVLFTLRNSKTSVIASVIMCAMGVPMLGFWGGLLHLSDSPLVWSFFFISVILTVLSAAGILLTTYSNAMSRFNYLHSREKVDMTYSLPMTKKQRYIGDFIAGIAFPLLPYIAGCILGFVLFSFFSGLSGGNSELLRFFRASYMSSLGLLFYYTFIVAVISLVGRKREAASVPVILAVVLPAIFWIVYALLFSRASGFNFNPANPVNNFAFVSPLSFGIYAISAVTEQNMNIGTIVPLILTVLMICGLFAAGLSANKHRDAEKCGTPFTVKFGFPVYMFVSLFAIISIFVLAVEDGDLGEYFVPYAIAFVLATLVPFAVMYFTHRGGFKKVAQGLCMYVIMTLAGTGIAAALPAVNGFGIYDRLPSPAQVRNISVSEQYDTLTGAQGFYGNFSDTDNVQKIIDANKKMSAFKWNSARPKNIFVGEYADRDYVNLGYAHITYYLKNGEVWERNLMYDRDLVPELKKLYWSNEAKQSLWNNIEDGDEYGNVSYSAALYNAGGSNTYAIKDPDDYIGEEADFFALTEVTAEGPDVSEPAGTTAEGPDVSEPAETTAEVPNVTESAEATAEAVPANTAVFEKVFNSTESAELEKAYKADFMTKTYENTHAAGNAPLAELRINKQVRTTDGTSTVNTYSFSVTANDKNTIAALDKLGVKLPAVYEGLKEIIIERRDYIDDNAAGDTTALNPKKNAAPNDSYTAVKDIDDDVKKLLSVIQEWSDIQGGGYTVNVRNKTFVVPDEYNELAKKIIENRE